VDVWAPALERLRYADVPLTFLMHRSLWEAMGGIPEPPACHMDVLARALFQRGELIAEVKDVCTHARLHPFPQALMSFYQAGWSYGAVAREGIPNALANEVSKLSAQQVAFLVKITMMGLHRLGALTGLGVVPEAPLDVGVIKFEWMQKR
jgi:hypothetical protein